MVVFNIEKLNVQDEIPSGAIRFDIKTDDGNVIYSNVDIMMVTKLLQEGTPLNKALHDKIDYIGECVSALDNVGEDIKKFIETGEFQGMKLLQIDGEEYNKFKLNDELSQINSSISTLNTRVSTLEGSLVT